jgi:predicted esterase YcpF (UPF0227 family)
MIYFVLHGFASATPNANTTFVQDNLLGVNDTVVNLNYNFNPLVGVPALERTVAESIELFQDTEVAFIGCSLGGYIAQYLAMRFSGRAIAINPAIEPDKSLKRTIGTNKNFATGAEFEMTIDHVKSYKRYRVRPGRVPTLVLLDMGDEVLDATDAIRHFDDNAEIKTFEGGCHRFSHHAEALPYVKAFINTITA